MWCLPEYLYAQTCIHDLVACVRSSALYIDRPPTYLPTRYQLAGYPTKYFLQGFKKHPAQRLHTRAVDLQDTLRELGRYNNPRYKLHYLPSRVNVEFTGRRVGDKHT